MPDFLTHHDVRRFLKEAGITDRVKIRWSDNPFGGGGRFYVTLADEPPKGSGIFSAFGSNQPYTFGCMSDIGRPWVDRLSRIHDALRGTNATTATSL